ncbi:hypothetical protein BDR03DRAFT_969341 [Suillus americanus]|nr:hypothetical protein BDR03DRAFT_969341 [Suillus americanus]
MVPCVGYAVARTTMDASALKTRESFMFEFEERGATFPRSAHKPEFSSIPSSN